jgi:hypothetical protein
MIIMSEYSISRAKTFSWVGLITAVFSLITTHSVVLQFVLLGLGAVMFTLAALRIARNTATNTLASKKVLLALSSIAAASFLIRFAILLATSQPARYGEYSTGANPLIQGIASNTNAFYLASLVLLLGATLVALVAVYLPKRSSAHP